MRLSDVGREVSTFNSGVADVSHVFAVRTVEVLGNGYASYWEGRWEQQPEGGDFRGIIAQVRRDVG